MLLTFAFASLLALADASSPDELLYEARQRARHGDFEGVRILAEEALAQEGSHQREAQMLIGVSWEFSGDPHRGLAYYEAVAGLYTPRDTPLSVRFRLAECSATAGDYKGARRILRKTARLHELDEPHETMLLSDLGTWELALDRDDQGIKRLIEVITEHPSSSAKWWVAQARHSLISTSLGQANGYSLEGTDADRSLALETRAALIQVALEQIVPLVELEQTSFTVDALVLLGDAYSRLGQEVLETEETDRERKAEAVLLKALRMYDRADRLAVREGWQDPIVDLVPKKRKTVQARLDGLPKPLGG